MIKICIYFFFCGEYLIDSAIMVVYIFCIMCNIYYVKDHLDCEIEKLKIQIFSSGVVYA